MHSKLKDVNMMSIVVLSMMSIKLITLPGDVIKYAKNDAWISVLLTGIITYLSAYIVYYIAVKYSGYNFAEINIKVLGPLLGRIPIILITTYAVVSAGISLRLFADSMKEFLLDRTPSIVIVTLMLFTCVYCLVKGIKTISIVFDMILPIILVIIIIILMPYKSAELKDLLPIGYGGIKPIVQGALQAIDPAIGCGIVSYVMPYFSDKKKTKKWVFIAVTIAIATYTIIVIMCIIVFGVIEVQYLNFPTISLAKTIEFRAELFERTEILFMAAWIPAVFANIVTLFIVATFNLKVIFNIKKTNLDIFLIIPVVLIITFIPRNIVEVYKYLLMNDKLAIYINLIYIPILFIIVLLKGEGNKKNEK